MKIKLDENLPLQIAARLARLGHDVQTMQNEGLSGCNDSDLWRAAQREQRVLLTQDLDFSDTRSFVPGRHHGILLVRLNSPSRRKLIERIEQVFHNENADAWVGCFVVVTEYKVRVRRAPSQS